MKIDKGIPIPPITQGRRGNAKKGPAHAFRTMQPSDSVFFPGMKPKHGGGLLCRAKRACKDLPPRKWTVRTIDDGKVKGVRIWRVE